MELMDRSAGLGKQIMKCDQESLRQTTALNSTITGLRTDVAVRYGVNRTIEKQNGDQQSTINGCLSQAMKLLTPEPLKITSHELRGLLPQSPQPGYKFVISYVVMTNKIITPVRLLVTCEADNILAEGWVLGTGTMMAGGWGGMKLIRLTNTEWVYFHQHGHQQIHCS
jgi:hypothetical protein